MRALNLSSNGDVEKKDLSLLVVKKTPSEPPTMDGCVSNIRI